MNDIHADAYIDCGSVIEAIYIEKDGKTFKHYSIPSYDAIIVDHSPVMELEDFLREESETEERIKKIRVTRKLIQAQADKTLDELPDKLTQAAQEDPIEEKKEHVEGYR